MEPKDIKKAESTSPGFEPRAWNTVKFERLSEQQVAALQTVRAVHDGNVRWTAVQILTGQIELTLHYVDEESRRCMRLDPDTIYARRIVVLEDGSVRIKEQVSL